MLTASIKFEPSLLSSFLNELQLACLRDSKNKSMTIAVGVFEEGSICIDLNSVKYGGIRIFVTIVLIHVSHKTIEDSILNAIPLVDNRFQNLS